MIYFVVCRAANAVKIGYATQAYHLTEDRTAFERLHTLQTGCPFELEIAGISEGSKSEEAELHLRFGLQRIRGEWFRITPELEGHFTTLHKPVRLPRGWHHKAKRAA